MNKLSTVVYLGNQEIQVVTGTTGNKKISVSGYYTTQAPEGSIINGMIMDIELFVGHLRDFWAQYRLPNKDVVLVINSTKFVGKKIEAPANLNEKKLKDFIEREYSDVKKDDELIYGYIPIGKSGNMKQVYAETIYPDFIKDYIDIFKELGVKISAIYSGESSLINLVAMTIGSVYKNFVMQIADKMTLITLLFVNGSFYYFNSIRCFHEKDSYDYTLDVARSVSQIMQFMQAHQIDAPLDAVVLGGINYANLSMYQSAIMQQGINCRIEIFESMHISSPNCDIQSCLNGASGLVLNGKNQNFLTLYNQAKKNLNVDDSKKKLIKSIATVGSVFVVMLIILIGCIIYRSSEKKKLKKIENYNTDTEVVMDVAMYNSLMQRNAFLNAQYGSIHDIEENLETYPVGNSTVKDIIVKSAGNLAEISFDAFDSDAGVLSMSAKSANVDEISVFIKSLKQLEIFSSVDYSGYTYVDLEGMWKINVNCILNESAGR